jgi:hypothetical protein
MIPTLLSLVILLGVAGKALVNRYWLAAAIALSIAYVIAGLLAHALRATWPVIGALVERGPVAVLGVLIAVPAIVCGIERQRHGEGTPRREVADLFGLIAVVHAGAFLWTLAIS